MTQLNDLINRKVKLKKILYDEIAVPNVGLTAIHLDWQELLSDQLATLEISTYKWGRVFRYYILVENTSIEECKPTPRRAGPLDTTVPSLTSEVDDD